MRYGVSDAIWEQILNTCSHYPDVKHVILYGSRARGDEKPGSDIDLAIDAPDMPDQTFARLWNTLDDLPIIFSMDVVHLQAITNQLLLQAIRDEGMTL
jgi:uncharacterized protein